MDCRSFRASVFLLTDNEAGQDLVVAFREHVNRCPGCAREMDRAVRVVTIVRQRCCREAAPRALRIRILERVAGKWDGADQ
jgi:mycothiol system anti-sigma-R factor